MKKLKLSFKNRLNNNHARIGVRNCNLIALVFSQTAVSGYCNETLNKQ